MNPPMKRNKRAHGRILSVETMQRGSALAADAAAAATTITVDDAGDFDEDGGWLYIGTQVVEFTACDDDTGVITLATGLTAAAEQGDPVHVYDPLYAEVVDYQVALVQLDGEYDNPDPVEAEVAEGVNDLPEGDRGKAGESCTLLRIAADEWEVVGVGGRSRKSRGLRAEAHDVYVLAAGDITAGTATIPLSHRPESEWLKAWWDGLFQEPTEYSIDYDAQTITWPLDGFEGADDRIAVHYAYRKGIQGGYTTTLVDWQAAGWKYLQVARTEATDRSAVGFDDSGWAVGPAAFGYIVGTPHPLAGWPGSATNWSVDSRLWLRRQVDVPEGCRIVVDVRIDNIVDIYWNGTLVQSGGDDTFYLEGVEIPASLVTPGLNTLAVRATDDSPVTAGDRTYLDVRVKAVF